MNEGEDTLTKERLTDEAEGEIDDGDAILEGKDEDNGEGELTTNEDEGNGFGTVQQS